MKNNFSLLILIIFIITSSCVSVRQQTAKKTSAGDYEVIVKNSFNIKLTIVTIDSCEYLVGGIGKAPQYFTHKGNCKYCAARQK